MEKHACRDPNHGVVLCVGVGAAVLRQIAEDVLALPLLQRAAVILCCYDRLSASEAARVIGCSTRSVTHAHSAARLTLDAKTGLTLSDAAIRSALGYAIACIPPPDERFWQALPDLSLFDNDQTNREEPT